VLELALSSPRVLAWLGPRAVLDAVMHTDSYRIASDELLVVSWDEPCPDPPPGVMLVADQAGGFACWTLSGPDAEEAFARLSELELPSPRPGFLQGAVAGVPAKVIAGGDLIHVLVSSSLRHHLRERVLEACPDLGVVEAAR
jgi:hypothetical protein